jgi:hypothetical protein
MIDAALIKDLEKRGFSLDLPEYNNNDRIISILKLKNERLYTAIPLLLLEDFNYEFISKKLKTTETFDKIINISCKIFEIENIKNNLPKKNIQFSEYEFNYFYNIFKDCKKNEEELENKKTKKTTKQRNILNLNQSLSKIFSPSKIIIMYKIFNYKEITNSELKYYYKSIRPIILSILDEDLRKYIKIIENTKKITNKIKTI